MPSDYPPGAVAMVHEYAVNIARELRCGQCSALIATPPFTLHEYGCPMCGARIVLELADRGEPNSFVTYPPAERTTTDATD